MPHMNKKLKFTNGPKPANILAGKEKRTRKKTTEKKKKKKLLKYVRPPLKIFFLKKSFDVRQ
jgi:hypothetical protein